MTTPPAGLSILQLTDLHILADQQATLLGINTAHYFEAVLALAFAEQSDIDLVLLTGDLAQEPVAVSYRYILDKMRPCGLQCLCLPGNHDDYDLMRQILNVDNISCRKQQLFDDWQIICLNSQIPGSEGGALAAEELAFAEQWLQAYSDRHALIAVHHHCLPTDSDWMDTMQIANSAELWALVARYPQVRLILNGHIHQEMDKRFGGVRVLGTPSTCFQFTPNSVGFGLDDTPPAYRIIRLNQDGSLATQVSRLSGRLAELRTDIEGY